MCIRPSVCVCVHEMEKSLYVRLRHVCVWHGIPLLCKNDQTSLLLCCVASYFLFVSATTLIHSILLFITKWLLTKLLYALTGAHTNLFINPSFRDVGSIRVIHKVDFIAYCYFFNIHIKVENISSVWKLKVCWCFEYHVTFIEVTGKLPSQP